MNDRVLRLLHWAPKTRPGRMVYGFVLGASVVLFFGLAGVLATNGGSANWSTTAMNAVIVGAVFAFLWGFIFPKIWNRTPPGKPQ